MNRSALLEAVLFVCGEPVEIRQLAEWMQIPAAEVRALAEEAPAGSGLVIRRFGDRLQLATAPELSGELTRIFAKTRDERLSNSLLETLTIVAYRQPVTRQEIDVIRGVHSTYALSALVDRGLVEKVGTKDALGRPVLYGTTDLFLRQFSLGSLRELPPLTEAEQDGLAPPAPEDNT